MLRGWPSIDTLKILKSLAAGVEENLIPSRCTPLAGATSLTEVTKLPPVEVTLIWLVASRVTASPGMPESAFSFACMSWTKAAMVVRPLVGVTV